MNVRVLDALPLPAVYAIVTTPPFDIDLVTKAARVLSLLLLVSPNVWYDEASVSHRPTLAWRPFFEMLRHTLLPDELGAPETEGRQEAANACSALVADLSKRMRDLLTVVPRHFEAASGAEMWAHFEPRLCVDSLLYARDAAVMALLLPSAHAHAVTEQRWIPRLLHLSEQLRYRTLVRCGYSSTKSTKSQSWGTPQKQTQAQCGLGISYTACFLNLTCLRLIISAHPTPCGLSAVATTSSPSSWKSARSGQSAASA